MYADSVPHNTWYSALPFIGLYRNANENLAAGLMPSAHAGVTSILQEPLVPLPLLQACQELLQPLVLPQHQLIRHSL